MKVLVMSLDETIGPMEISTKLRKNTAYKKE